MREMTSKPKPTNNNAKIIFTVTLILGVALSFASMMLERYRGVVGMVALGLLCTAIFYYTKFISAYFLYDLTFDSDGTAIFVVRQVTGKRSTTLCRIALYEIDRIDKETKEQRKSHLTPKGTRKYVYFPTVSPSVSYRIFTKNRYETSEVLIEGTDEFIHYFNECVSEAKEIEARSDENY